MNNWSKIIRFLCATCVLWLLAGVAPAQVPHKINYQGLLNGPGGTGIDGAVSMTFRLYDVAVGGTALYTESQNVTAAKGVFEAVIGSAIALTLPFDVPYFLGITVGDDAEMAPRQALTATPYALRSAALDASAAVPAVQVTGTIGTSQIADAAITAAKLATSGCANGQVFKLVGASWQCAHDANSGGTVTGITATGDGGLVTSPPAGITSSGSIGIAANGVTAAMIADGSVGKAKLSAGGGAPGQVLTTDGAALQWTAPPAAPATGYPLTTTTTEMAGTGTSGQTGAITIGLDGLPIVAYREYSAGVWSLVVKQCASAICTSIASSATLDSQAGDASEPFGGVAITIGTDGNPVVAYSLAPYQTGSFRVAKCGTANCAAGTTLSDPLPGYQPNIAIGANGFPMVSSVYIGELRVWSCTDNACTAPSGGTEIVYDAASLGHSMIVGLDGYPVVAYVSPAADGGKLKFIKCTAPDCSTWNSANFAADFTNSRYPSMVLGADGLPIILYSIVSLAVTKCGNAACNSGNVSAVLDFNLVGDRVAVALGGDDLPVVAYSDSANGDLQVLKCSTHACGGTNIKMKVATLNNVGGYPAIATGADGLPIISHLDATTQRLKVTKCSTGTCAPYAQRRR